MTFPASLSYSDLTGTLGFNITGPSGSIFGHSVSLSGDINGDGKNDLVVGAYNANTAYVIFGASSFSSSLSYSALNGANGFSITGPSNGDFGSSVSLGGDINGDGKDDLVVGADYQDMGAAAAYVIFGASSFSASLSYSALNGTNGFSITGSNGFGSSVFLGGDINGDGKHDLVVGAYYASTAYVIFGASSFSASLSYSALNGANGFSITGVSNSWFGVSVSLGGDINGDGRDDLVVGASYGITTGNGVAYVIFGASSFSASLSYSSLNGANGFSITGPSSSYFGNSVSLGGDINGDGKDDLVVGTNGGNAAYVIFGASSFSSSLSYSALNGANGFSITGPSSTAFGYSVSLGGDINGDGKDDLVVGAEDYNSGCTYCGAVYVIFGASSFGASLSYSALNGANGFSITGLSSSYFGVSVSLGADLTGKNHNNGDVNGNGVADLVVGAYGTNAAYVMFGQNCTAGCFLSPAPLPAPIPAPHPSPAPIPQPLPVPYPQPVPSPSPIPSPNPAPQLLPSPAPMPIALPAPQPRLLPQPASASNSAPSPVPMLTPVPCPTPPQQLGVSAVFDVDCALTGSNGFQLTGTTNTFGYSVASAGDFNGDGIQDVVIGSSINGPGAAYVVFGTSKMFPCTGGPPCSYAVDSLLTGSNGFKLTSTSSYFGYSVASAGDFNGDGIQDIVIGTFTANAAYVVFGVKGTFPCTGTSPCSYAVDSLLTGSNGFKLTSTSTDFGYSVASTGDLNGDRIQDIVIGAFGANTAYVVFGSKSAFATPFVMSSLNGTNGFQLTCTTGHFGGRVASTGDINGDGKADIIIGADTANNAYVIYGSSAFATPFAMSSLNGNNGFQLTSTSSNFGLSVASAGDFNGDGILDIAIGAYIAKAVYIVFGVNGTFPCTGASPCSFDVDSLLTGSNGFKLISASTEFGWSIVSAGDLNGDGIQDIVIGAYGAAVAYVVFGSRSTFQTPYNVDSLLNGSNGFKLTSTSAQFGVSVASAGDLNGDGKKDLIMGTNSASGGAAYVIYGIGTAASPVPSPQPAASPVPLALPQPAPSACCPVFPAVLNVDNSTAFTTSNGFKLTSTSNSFGNAVASAGDFNLDGILDIVIGTYASANAAYVVFGINGMFPCVGMSPCLFNVDSLLNGSNGFKLTSSASAAFGYSVSSAGDFNGDKIPDIVIGTYSNANAAYVVFGTNGRFPCTGSPTCSFDVDSQLNGTNGFKLTSTNSQFGYSVASAGDFNWDGFQDIVIAASCNGCGSPANAVYVIFGTNAVFPCSGGPPCLFNVDSSLNGTNGFKLTSTSRYFGWFIASVGDLNMDNIHDIVIGASCNGCGSPANAAYVVFGISGTFPCTGSLPCSFDVDSKLNGTNGLKFTSTSSYFGASVASAGDFNGDGVLDIVIGALANSAYIIFGTKGTFPCTGSSPCSFDMDSQLNGTNGFKLTSTTSNFGYSAASAGDLNGDWVQDIIIGTNNGQAAYVVFGTRGTLPCTGTSPCTFAVDSLLTGRNGFKLTSTSSGFGVAVANAGDVNGDKTQDIVVGAYVAKAAYVIYGQNCATGCFIPTPQPIPTPSLIPEPSPIPSPAPSPAPIFVQQPITQTASSCVGGIFPTVLNVTYLNGCDGFQLTSATSYFGSSVASAGDLNGDGIQDIIIYGVYVVFGSRSAYANPFVVDYQLTGSNGFKLTSTSSYFGFSIASTGDLNGDGITDVVVGAPGANATYIIFGNHSTYTNPFAVDSQLVGSNGFKLTSTSSNFGNSVAGAGDFNGDGMADIVIAAGCAPTCANTVYVIFGSHSPYMNPFSVDSNLIGSNGFKLTSISYNFGNSVASAGDLNGDSIQDIVIGAASANAAYVIFGSRSPYANPFAVDSSINGSNGFKLTSTSGAFGCSVASAGDFNGDGIQDIVMGAYQSNTAYVVFGSNAFPSSFAVDSQLTGSNGFKLTSVSNYFGWSVASAGDFNGDGIQDIVIGTYANVVYIIFGSRSAFQSTFAVDSQLTGRNGFKLTSTGGNFGSSVAGAGDINTDGLQDVVIGTNGADAAYVIFGRNNCTAVCPNENVSVPYLPLPALEPKTLLLPTPQTQPQLTLASTPYPEPSLVPVPISQPSPLPAPFPHPSWIPAFAGTAPSPAPAPSDTPAPNVLPEPVLIPVFVPITTPQPVLNYTSSPSDNFTTPVSQLCPPLSYIFSSCDQMRWWGSLISGIAVAIGAIAIFDIGFIATVIIRGRGKPPQLPKKHPKPKAKASHALHGHGPAQEMQPMLPRSGPGGRAPGPDLPMPPPRVMPGVGSMLTAPVMPMPAHLAASLASHLASPAPAAETPVPTQAGPAPVHAHAPVPTIAVTQPQQQQSQVQTFFAQLFPTPPPSFASTAQPQQHHGQNLHGFPPLPPLPTVESFMANLASAHHQSALTAHHLPTPQVPAQAAHAPYAYATNVHQVSGALSENHEQWSDD